MPLEQWGALAFGFVVGWVTYRTIRRSRTNGLSDIATVIGAVGGAAVTSLFPAGSSLFGAYGVGLAAGFMLYLGTALALAARGQGGVSAADVWLGASPRPGGAPGRRLEDLPGPRAPAGTPGEPAPDVEQIPDFTR